MSPKTNIIEQQKELAEESFRFYCLGVENSYSYRDLDEIRDELITEVINNVGAELLRRLEELDNLGIAFKATTLVSRDECVNFIKEVTGATN